MKILVIDDQVSHREMATRQLANRYDLRVVGEYDEALSCLGFGDLGYRRSSNRHDYDVVLVDLQMPVSSQGIGDQLKQQFEGMSLPIGIFLALLAAKNGSQVRHVAVFTDADHHSHPASAVMDAFNPHESEPAALEVSGAKLWLVNNRAWVDVRRDGALDEELSSADAIKAFQDAPGFVRVKFWDKLLEHILD